MLKKFTVILLAFALVLAAFGANAQTISGYAVVEGETSDRVNMRTEMSAHSTSMGLYFTGTPVMYQLIPGSEWAAVTIGTQNGYMMARYLNTNPASVYPLQPIGTIKSSSVNVRSEEGKQSPVLAVAYRGETVTVYGETRSHWYLVDYCGYVGYIQSQYVSLNSYEPSGSGAFVMGLTSDRVHLRAEMSTSGPSMGLYFTGAPVTAQTVDGTWSRVTIGNETGYMMSKYLYYGSSYDLPSLPTGYINARSVNIRYESTKASGVAAVANRNDIVSVMGETHNGWYYVDYGGVKGYVMAEFVSGVN